MTDDEIIKIACKHCKFVPEGTYLYKQFESKYSLIEFARECIALARTPTAGNTEDARSMGAVSELIAKHAALLEDNPYCYFELAYTRSTEWMAWICSKPSSDDPGRKVIAKGQGATPDEACRAALTQAASTGGGHE